MVCLYAMLVGIALLAAPQIARGADPGDLCSSALDNSWQISTTNSNMQIYCDGTRWRPYVLNDESGAATSRAKQVMTFGMDSTACSADLAGTVRYQSGTNAFEYCNATSWISFPSGATATCTIRNTVLNNATVTRACNAGEKMTGGGCSSSSRNVTQTFPSNLTTWSCRFDNSDSSNTAYAICCTGI